MTIVLGAISVLAGLVMVAVFQQDLMYRRIPNVLPIVVVGLGSVKWAVVLKLSEFGWALLAGAVVLTFTGLLFWRGWMGGGDVKLLTSTSFLLGGPDTPGFIFATSLFGGVVALIVFVYSLVGNRGERTVAGGGAATVGAAKTSVPYGTAIALAALWILFKQWTSR
jgi:prepilin peptidase CpaA